MVSSMKISKHVVSMNKAVLLQINVCGDNGNNSSQIYANLITLRPLPPGDILFE